MDRRPQAPSLAARPCGGTSVISELVGVGVIILNYNNDRFLGPSRAP
jgi:hypothetical protein